MYILKYFLLQLSFCEVLVMDVKFLEAAEITISAGESPIPHWFFSCIKSSSWAWAMAAITAHSPLLVCLGSWVGRQGLVSPESLSQSVTLICLPWPKPCVSCYTTSPTKPGGYGEVTVQLTAPVPWSQSFRSFSTLLWAPLTAAPATPECLETRAGTWHLPDILKMFCSLRGNWKGDWAVPEVQVLKKLLKYTPNI